MCWSYLDLFGPAHGKLAWIKSCIFDSLRNGLCNYTMGCSPVRGDNPRALASGLPYVQVDKHCIIFYTTYISVDLAHHEIFRAKVGMGSIKVHTCT